MIRKVAFIFILILLVCNEIPAKGINPPESIYYWFYIKLGKITDKETGISRMVLKRIGSQIESGTYDDFIKTHKLNLKLGKILLGPFPDKKQAQNAFMNYQFIATAMQDAENKTKTSKSDTLYSYYFTRPVIGKWIKSVKFQHIPSRVATGTEKEFMDLMKEGLYYEKLAIGPFFDFDLAEKSKFIFRKNGEMEEDNSSDTLSRTDITNMSGKWESVKIELVKLSAKKKTNEFNYQLKIKFPKKYFVSEAFQTFTVKARYSDTSLVSNTGITLQGDFVMDNNPVISFDKGGLYTQNLSFTNYKNTRLKGFLVESFIFNNTEMIDQKKVFIQVK
jgi:hypothetical protein